MKTTLKSPIRSLIKLHFLKHQMYKKKSYKYIRSAFVDNITIELKQALKIIYLYHTQKKSITFIGLPYNKTIHNKLNHSFISKNVYKKRNLINDLLLIKPDLIVFNGSIENDTILLKKLEKLNIPLILFGDFPKINNKTYSIQVSLKTNRIKAFCFFLIFSVLIK